MTPIPNTQYPSITLDQIMALKPCGHDQPHDGQNYTRRRVQELLAGRKTITIPEIAAEETVPLKDRFWLITKMLTDVQNHELDCRCAERVLITSVELLAAHAADAADDAHAYAADAAADAAADNNVWTWQINQALALAAQTDEAILAGLKSQQETT
jgi:uncharacterized membrane protein